MTATSSTALFSLQILEAIVSGDGPSGVTELATRLDIPKGRVHRHLSQLRDAGYLYQSPSTKLYELGWRLSVLGERIGSHSSVVKRARPIMADLRNTVGQTVVYSQPSDAGVTVTEVLPGGSPIDVILERGTQFGFNASAQGKVALAFASDQQRKRWEESAVEKRTDQTVMDSTVLAKQVVEVKTQGWAQAPGETYQGINCIAVPVLDHSQQVVGTLAIVAAVHYLPDPPPMALVDALVAAGRRLSSSLGNDIND